MKRAVLRHFISADRGKIVERCRAKAASRLVTPLTGAAMGVGLGLAFSRWGAEVNGGRVYARSLPGTGCVFTVDLPRLPMP